ncbi:hypothetical protein L1049_012148 [Liquidambar formosana]|uniref:Alpha-1,4 glucan phosphorylase n=1 Tax=Liquidambar formosana TaxID=63359 RepID=A0AAP0RSD1_LIQFO
MTKKKRVLEDKWIRAASKLKGQGHMHASGSSIHFGNKRRGNEPSTRSFVSSIGKLLVFVFVVLFFLPHLCCDGDGVYGFYVGFHIGDGGWISVPAKFAKGGGEEPDSVIQMAKYQGVRICYILYPGDESMEGKILRLKQQYTLCSASLQDIIARFERRSGSYVNWDEFPEKVAVQMNDTHPTLCIPELMRILIDLKDMSWKEAWNITQRTVAYTNHTVLPEALEKWSLELMQKLLPRHVEIIEMIDEELIHTIVLEYGTADPNILEKKLKEMRILENVDLPASVADLFVKAPVVETSEELESSDEEVEPNDEEEEPKGELSDEEPNDEEEEPKGEPNDEEEDTQKKKEVLSEPIPKPPKMLWPEKFQNKTNGVTPRRWILFCNPCLSKIITKWTRTEDWVLNTEKLAELRKVLYPVLERQNSY